MGCGNFILFIGKCSFQLSAGDKHKKNYKTR